MTIEDTWLAHLRAIVDKEAQIGGSLRAGYRSVATKLAKNEEYIYQLYKGKPKSDGTPRVVTLEFSKAMARHYAEGRPPSWINTPPAGEATRIEEKNGPTDPGSVAPITTWPFKTVGYKRFMALPREAQREIDNYLESMVMTWERKGETIAKSRKH